MADTQQGAVRVIGNIPMIFTNLGMLDLPRPNAMHASTSSKGNTVELKKVSVDIDYVVCKGNQVDSQTLAHHIQAYGKAAGYEVEVNPVSSGGNHQNPIARVQANGRSKEEIEKSINEITTITRDGFQHLIEHAKNKSAAK